MPLIEMKVGRKRKSFRQDNQVGSQLVQLVLSTGYLQLSDSYL